MTSPDVSAFLRLDHEAHRDPWPLFRAVDRDGPVHRDTTTGFVVVTRHADIQRILNDPDLFSSANVFGPELTEMSRLAERFLTPEQQEHFLSPAISIITSAGDDHRRLRQAANPYFTQAAMRRRAPAVRAHAAAALDALDAADSAGRVPADWLNDVCVPFSIGVICDILGVQETDRDTVRRWDDLLISLATGGTVAAETVAAYLEFTKEFTDYFRERAAHVRDRPNDSLLSHLVNHTKGLTEKEIIQLLMILFPAGSSTTLILFTHMAVRLATEPGLMDELRHDPDRRPRFVEESVVQRTPSVTIFRTATRDTTVAGTPVRAGEHLLLAPLVANENLPDIAGHLAFGYGPHRCLGAQLARTEALALLEETLARYRAITLTRPLAELPVRAHLVIPAYLELPVSLHTA